MDMDDLDRMLEGYGDPDGDKAQKVADIINTVRSIAKKSQTEALMFVAKHTPEDISDGMSAMIALQINFGLLNKLMEFMENAMSEEAGKMKLKEAPKKRAEQIERLQKQSEAEVDAFLDFLNSHPEIKDKGIGAVNNEAVKWFDKDKKEEE